MATKVKPIEINVQIIRVESPEGDVYNFHDIIEWDYLIHQIALSGETGWKVTMNERDPEAIGEIGIDGKVNGHYLFDEFSQMLASKIKLKFSEKRHLSSDEKLDIFRKDCAKYFEGKEHEYLEID